MLWNKRKAEPFRNTPDLANRSGYRVAEPDRALTTVGTLLATFGRFAFDTEVSAEDLRQECTDWAERILLGERRRADDDGAEHVGRDWRALERFFEEARKREQAYVEKGVGGLRGTVLSLARALSGSIGADRDADKEVEGRIDALSRAVEQGDVTSITRTASAVIETTRTAMAQRRERETRHAAQLDAELRELREALIDDHRHAATDELTGLFAREPYLQQLEQLTGLGALLQAPPWLLLIDVTAGRPDPGRSSAGRRPRAVPDATLRELSKAISRTFLRRQDFTARTGPSEFAIFVVDMNQSEMAAATERLIGNVYNACRALPSGEQPVLAIGGARLRSNEDPERWRARADLAVQRSREDGDDCYNLSP